MYVLTSKLSIVLHKFVFIFPGAIFFSTCVLQPRSTDWKAEFLYTIIFHRDNLIHVDDLPLEIRCLAPGYDVSEEDERLLWSLAQQG